jgi:hypothetical protein
MKLQQKIEVSFYDCLLYMLKEYSIILLIFFTLLNISCGPGKEEDFIPACHNIPVLHNYYKDAEYFRYSTYFGPVHAGVLQIQTDDAIFQIDDRPCYHVKVNSHLKGIAGWISDLDDSWESHIDTLTLLPYKFSRNLRESKYKKDEYTLFQRKEGKALVTDTTNRAVPKIHTYSITPEIEDMISAFFLLRNVSFPSKQIEDTITINVFLDDKSYNIKTKYLGVTKVNSKIGKLKAFMITPIIPGGEENQIKVYISADERRILLKVQAKFLLGSLEMNLQEYRKNKKN